MSQEKKIISLFSKIIIFSKMIIQCKIIMKIWIWIILNLGAKCCNNKQVKVFFLGIFSLPCAIDKSVEFDHTVYVDAYKIGVL